MKQRGSDRRNIPAAYGGQGWSPRRSTSLTDLGQIWSECGQQSEWKSLRRVMLHEPGSEWSRLDDANAVQMRALPDFDLARQQHKQMAAIYDDLGVEVTYVSPDDQPTPNLAFVADLLFSTPEGIILGRPASTVRAGEERWIARRLLAEDIPVLRMVSGTGLFEGADAMWLADDKVVIGTGFRTNHEGAAQVAEILRRQSVDCFEVEIPSEAMHLMGLLRIVDRDLAITWPGRTPNAALSLLAEHRFTVLSGPDETESKNGQALNFVTIGPREVVMAAANPLTEKMLTDAGVTCHTVEIGELAKAAGGIACMTGIVHRDK